MQTEKLREIRTCAAAQAIRAADFDLTPEEIKAYRDEFGDYLGLIFQNSDIVDIVHADGADSPTRMVELIDERMRDGWTWEVWEIKSDKCEIVAM